MKKAKILVPAIAALVLSSAAAVTGTVAWFTSTTNASVKGQSLTVVNTSAGSLSYALAAGAGTTLKGNTSNDPGYIIHSTLIDGSVDLKSSDAKVYQPNNAGATEFEEIVSPYTVGANQRATKFTITFSYTFFKGAGVESAKLFLNTVNSKVTDNAGGTVTPTGQDILPALRIGFKTTASYRVWAPFNDATTLDYRDATGKVTYAQGNVIAAGVNTPTNKATTDAAIRNEIGTFTAKGSYEEKDVQTLAVDVYTWVEGEDTSCKNEKALFANLKQVLSFDTVDSKTAAIE